MATVTSRTISIEIADGWGDDQFLALRMFDLTLSGVSLGLTSSDYTTYATSEFSGTFAAENAFDTTTSIIGQNDDNEWTSANGSITNQKLVLVTNADVTYDGITINNSHDFGGETNRGIRNATITISGAAVSGIDDPLVSPLQIFDGEVPRHINQDIADPFLIQIAVPGGSVASLLVQPYSFLIAAFSTLRYGNAPGIQRVLGQFYSDASILNRHLIQQYGDYQQLVSVLLQDYAITGDITTSLNQIFNIYGISNSAILETLYYIDDINQVRSVLKEIYNLQPANRVITQTETLTINGIGTEFRSMEVERDIDRHCNTADIVLLKLEDWVSVDFLQEVHIDVDGTVFEFVVFERNKSENVEGYDLEVSAASKSILLDFPYSKEVPGDFVLTTYSDTVNRLAALEGQTVDWRVEIDELLDNTAQSVTGLSPIEAIRQITGELKCVILSEPDGQLYVVPRRKARSNKLDQAAADYSFSTGVDFISTENTTTKNTGYNRFTVSPFAKSGRNYTQETIRVSDSESIIKIYETPWSNRSVDIITSEIGSIVGIERLPDVLTERNCNKVEIVDGSGTTTRGVFVLIDYDYETSRNLGIPKVDENRSVVTPISGESTVDITYFSRYRQWRVRHIGELTAQFILVSEDE